MYSPPSREALLTVSQQSGIWDGDPADPHGFVLAPYAFELSKADWQQLNQLSKSLFDCMQGVGKIVAIGEQPGLGGGSVFEKTAQLLKSGTSYQLPTTFPNRLPYLCKVDVVKTSQGFKVVEIDATNPRSWGYSILGRQLALTTNPEAQLLPGVVEALTRFSILKRQGAVTFLYGDTQRFYSREFQLFSSTMKDAGVAVYVVNETEVQIVDGQLTNHRGEALPHVLVDFPNLNCNQELIEWLKQATVRDQVRFLVPPQYFLASKNTMALLSNAAGNNRHEAMLMSLVDPGKLATLRSFLPPTWLVSKDLSPALSEEVAEMPENWVLKRSVSSGARGVWLGNDERFPGALVNAQKHPNTHILQTMAEPLQHNIGYYDPNGSLHQADNWQLRLTLYCSPRRVEDIAITARRDRLVHGATDAILAGTILV